MGERTMSSVVINESYWTQRITGQQRYATEIARRLAASIPCRAARPTGFWSSSPLHVWSWVQLVLPIAAGRALLLSMTARAPLWRRKHVLVVHDLFVLTNPEWFSRRYVWTPRAPTAGADPQRGRGRRSEPARRGTSGPHAVGSRSRRAERPQRSVPTSRRPGRPGRARRPMGSRPAPISWRWAAATPARTSLGSPRPTAC